MVSKLFVFAGYVLGLTQTLHVQDGVSQNLPVAQGVLVWTHIHLQALSSHVLNPEGVVAGFGQGVF